MGDRQTDRQTAIHISGHGSQRSSDALFHVHIVIYFVCDPVRVRPGWSKRDPVDPNPVSMLQHTKALFLHQLMSTTVLVG